MSSPISLPDAPGRNHQVSHMMSPRHTGRNEQEQKARSSYKTQLSMSHIGWGGECISHALHNCYIH